ncbi:MAG: hypothetical protein HYY18_18980 [Planctomycetes bacterium]|nr:hypothetical protein [Planctomycetota bacterium]
MTKEAFGRILDEVLQDLPAGAVPYLQNVVFRLESEAPDAPAREADWEPSALHGFQHLTSNWTVEPTVKPGAPMATATLYMNPILEAGPDTAAEVRRVVLGTIEARLGLAQGWIEKQTPKVAGWTPETESEEDEPEVHPAEDSAEGLVETAEAEIEAFPPDARDWFDEVEIVAVDKPEAAGDPARVADYPSPGDDLRVLVLYTQNIRRQPEPAPSVVRRILRAALARRTP